MQTSPASHRHQDISVQTTELFELVRIAWRRRVLILAAVSVSVVAGVLYLSVATPRYRTTARLLIERQEVAAEKRTHIRYEPAFVATQAEIVRSRSVVERALDVCMPPSISSAEDPVAAVLGSIRVKPVEGTNVMQVSYHSSDRAEAARMLEAVVASYSAYLRDSEQDTQLQTLTFLTESEREIREQLEQKQEEYRTLGNGSALPGVGHDAGRVHTEYLTNLGKALTDVKSRRLQLENQSLVWTKLTDLAREQSQAGFTHVSQTSAANISIAESLPESGDVLALPNMQQLDHVIEIRAVERELHAAQQLEKELDAQYGERHPDLRAVRSTMESLQIRKQEMLAAIPRILENELEVVRQDERELQQLYETEVQRVKQLDAQLLDDRQRLETIERLKAVHDSILADMHTRQLASGSAANGQGVIHVKTIAAPSSNGVPIWPVPTVVLTICCAAGLVAGFGMAVGMERFSFWPATRDRSAPQATRLSGNAADFAGVGQ